MAIANAARWLSEFLLNRTGIRAPRIQDRSSRIGAILRFRRRATFVVTCHLCALRDRRGLE